MFGPNWSEGQDRILEEPKHIELDDDDPESMHPICLVIYHHNNSEPRVSTPRRVLKVALHADKYQLNVALKYAAAFWQGDRGDAVSDGDRLYLLAAAFLFQAREHFVRLARELVIGHAGSYVGRTVSCLKSFRGRRSASWNSEEHRYVWNWHDYWQVVSKRTPGYTLISTYVAGPLKTRVHTSASVQGRGHRGFLKHDCRISSRG
ncbi:hypothetical protein VUR80DRAFT_6057 [Thermomyces stellatus]